jgi:hypothetical protein
MCLFNRYYFTRRAVKSRFPGRGGVRTVTLEDFGVAENGMIEYTIRSPEGWRKRIGVEPISDLLNRSVVLKTTPTTG